MKCNGLDDMPVPVIPIMGAGILLVLVRNTDLLKRAMKIAIRLQQVIIGAEVKAKPGKSPSRFRRLGKGQHIMFRAYRIRSENLMHLFRETVEAVGRAFGGSD